MLIRLFFPRNYLFFPSSHKVFPKTNLFPQSRNLPRRIADSLEFLPCNVFAAYDGPTRTGLPRGSAQRQKHQRNQAVCPKKIIAFLLFWDTWSFSHAFPPVAANHLHVTSNYPPPLTLLRSGDWLRRLNPSTLLAHVKPLARPAEADQRLIKSWS